jgi:hypothetical protein
MSHRPALALLAVVLLAFPAGALAQSAGDEQYTDPFGPTEEPRQEGGGSGGSDGAEAPAPDPAPAPAQEPAPQPAQQAEAPAAEPAPTLPYSGFPAALAAGAGAALLAAGAALRRRT